MMSKKRRIIRKIRPERHMPVDDQIWLLVVAMFVLGGFLAGTVLAYLRLDDPRWYGNAWTWLIAIPLVITTALVYLMLTGNRVLRRTMQLAIVLCAIIHIILFIFAVETSIFGRAWREVVARTEQVRPRKVVKVPEYFTWQHDSKQRAQQDFQQPVETPVPEPKVESERERQIVREPAVPRPQPRPVLEPEETIRPKVVKRSEPDAATPRRREQLSRLSRRASRVPAQPAQTAPVTPVTPAPRRSPRRPRAVEARDPGLRPRKTQRDSARQLSPPEPKMNESSRPPRVARKTLKRQQQPKVSARAALPRQVAPPKVTPRSDVRAAASPAVARQTQPDAPKPNNTLARKSRTRAPQRSRRVPQMAREPPSQAATRPLDRRQPTPRQPTLARTPRSLPNRRTRVTKRPRVVTTADRSVTVPSDQPNQLEPTPSVAAGRLQRQSTRSMSTGRASPEVADLAAARAEAPPRQTRRQTADRPEAEATVSAPKLPGRQPGPALALSSISRRASPPSSHPTTPLRESPSSASMAAVRTPLVKQAAGNAAGPSQRPPSDAVGAAMVAHSALPSQTRMHRSTRPSLKSQAIVTAPPLRALRDGARTASPRVAENPTNPVSRATNVAAQPQAPQLALSKADTGVAGGGSGQNIGPATPATSGQATVPSASARRAKSTQDMAPGPALAPHAQTLARTGRAGRIRPSATRRAMASPAPSVAGSRQPADVQASASAALTKAASDAASGPVTAAKGAADVDVGPTLHVVSSGAAHASGGGQPNPSAGSQHQVVPRSSPGSKSAASLMSHLVAAAPVAPVARGGGRSSAVASATGPQALVTARIEQTAPAVGGPASVRGGSLSMPSTAEASMVRRSRGANDSPESATDPRQVATVLQRASRPRQLLVEAGSADILAGNAGQRRQSDSPSNASIAPLVAVEALKQTAGEGATGRPAPGEIATDKPGAMAAAASARATRSEAVQGAPGPPDPGGGTASPERVARGPRVMADVRAETAVLAGGPLSSGQPRAEPLSSQGNLPSRLASGLDAPRSRAPVGAAASDAEIDAPAGGSPGLGMATISRSPSDDTGPLIRDSIQQGGAGKRSSLVQLPIASDVVTLNSVPSRHGSDQASGTDGQEYPGRPDVGPMRRAAGAAMPVDIPAIEGPGGLGTQVTMEVGVPRRHAREKSQRILLDATRFSRNRSGGLPDFNTVAAVAAEPFRRRMARGRGNDGGGAEPGPGPQTEEAIELGLAFLSRCQAPDGSWKLDQFAHQDGLPQLSSDTAATALALLAFQGAGYHHRDYRYAAVVKGGIDFLTRNQRPDGDLYVVMDEPSNRVVRFYSHGIAALAMCEAYGMTQDPALREPAQKAIDFIIQTQNDPRGGWRYTPGNSSDTSVTGWMMMALKSGELANLKVPAETYARIRKWLDRAQASQNTPHLYCYNPYAPDTTAQRGGRLPTKTMTSVGLLMRLYLGWRRDNPNMVRGAQYLLQYPPAIGTPSDPRRDTYYWYYATQVMFHMGGDYWKQWWNQRLHPLLVGSQIQEGDFAGSWDPFAPIPDRWAPHAGRLYVTTMNLLSLEVYYRHLPLYEDTAK